MTVKTIPTVNAMLNPEVQSVRFKAVSLIVSLTVYQNKWSKEAYRSFSLLLSQKSSRSREEKQPTGTDAKRVLQSIAYVLLSL